MRREMGLAQQFEGEVVWGTTEAGVKSAHWLCTRKAGVRSAY